MCLETHECSAHGGQRCKKPLELVAQEVVSHPMWLEVKLGSPTRAVCVISPAPHPSWYMSASAGSRVQRKTRQVDSKRKALILTPRVPRDSPKAVRM